MPSIAIIGASPNRQKFGNKAVRAYVQQGYTVYPVHPSEAMIEGQKAYPTITDVPRTPDFASLYVPPAIGITLLDALAAKGVTTMYVNPGAESAELVARAMELGLKPILACSIRAIGIDPATLSA
ncbi:MAG: CoA-binding protein [Candidatus Kerfeldbacteria bacterium]|nr:CoA-binding protein [Candidatus Kerfeldbacteria bacterium]